MGVLSRGLLVAGLALAPLAGARAQTFDITYTGTDQSDGGTSGASGSGSFTLNGSGGLAAFSFTLDQYGFDTNNNPATDVFTYGTNDVTSFDATVVGGQLVGLTLQTDELPPTYTFYTAFQVLDLTPGDAESYNYGDGFVITSGLVTVTAVPVPEPAAAVVFGVGLLGLGVARRRSASARV